MSSFSSMVKNMMEKGEQPELRPFQTDLRERFSKGMRVSHPLKGSGRIIAIGERTVSVEWDNKMRKILGPDRLGYADYKYLTVEEYSSRPADAAVGPKKKEPKGKMKNLKKPVKKSKKIDEAMAAIRPTYVVSDNYGHPKYDFNLTAADIGLVSEEEDEEKDDDSDDSGSKSDNRPDFLKKKESSKAGEGSSRRGGVAAHGATKVPSASQTIATKRDDNTGSGASNGTLSTLSGSPKPENLGWHPDTKDMMRRDIPVKSLSGSAEKGNAVAIGGGHTTESRHRLTEGRMKLDKSMAMSWGELMECDSKVGNVPQKKVKESPGLKPSATGNDQLTAHGTNYLTKNNPGKVREDPSRTGPGLDPRKVNTLGPNATGAAAAGRRRGYEGPPSNRKVREDPSSPAPTYNDFDPIKGFMNPDKATNARPLTNANGPAATGMAAAGRAQSTGPVRDSAPRRIGEDSTDMGMDDMDSMDTQPTDMGGMDMSEHETDGNEMSFTVAMAVKLFQSIRDQSPDDSKLQVIAQGLAQACAGQDRSLDVADIGAAMDAIRQAATGDGDLQSGDEMVDDAPPGDGEVAGPEGGDEHEGKTKLMADDGSSFGSDGGTSFGDDDSDQFAAGSAGSSAEDIADQVMDAVKQNSEMTKGETKDLITQLCDQNGGDPEEVLSILQNSTNDGGDGPEPGDVVDDESFGTGDDMDHAGSAAMPDSDGMDDDGNGESPFPPKKKEKTDEAFERELIAIKRRADLPNWWVRS